MKREVFNVFDRLLRTGQTTESDKEIGLWEKSNKQNMAAIKKELRKIERARKKELKQLRKEAKKNLVKAESIPARTSITNILAYITLGMIIIIDLGLIMMYKDIQSALTALGISLLSGCIIYAIILLGRKIIDHKDSSPMQKQVNELKKLAEFIDVCKEVVDESADIQLVQNAMDDLLDTLEIVINSDESLLKAADISKEKYEEISVYIQENYTTLLNKATERNKQSA